MVAVNWIEWIIAMLNYLTRKQGTTRDPENVIRLRVGLVSIALIGGECNFKNASARERADMFQLNNIASGQWRSVRWRQLRHSAEGLRNDLCFQISDSAAAATALNGQGSHHDHV